MADLAAEAEKIAREIEEERNKPKPPRPIRSEMEGDGRPGDDFNRRTTAEDVAQMLIRHGYQETRSNGGDKRHFTRPGKKAREGHSGTLFDTGLYYNFSDEDPHFKPDTSHTPFFIYATLEHGGDLHKASSELSRQGYGSRGNSFQRAGFDFSKYQRANGTGEDEKTSKASSSTRPRFEFLHCSDVIANMKPTEWLIDKIVPANALVSMFGFYGVHKTTVALDRLLHVASGLDYYGHPVKQGPVFYIPGEGQSAIGKRAAAWHIAHQTSHADTPFFIARRPTQLMDATALSDVRRTIDEMAAEYGAPAAVAFDTLARNFGAGDENSTRDMNQVVANVDLVFMNDFGRWMNHHTGWADQSRSRGSIVLPAAADAEFQVTIDGSGHVVVICKKMKDAPPAPTMVFKPRIIILKVEGIDDTACVLELVAEGEEAAQFSRPLGVVKLSGNRGQAVEILRKLTRRFKENLRKSGRPDAIPMVSYTDWRNACMDAGLYQRTDNFRKAFNSILAGGLAELDESGKFVHLREIIEDDAE